MSGCERTESLQGKPRWSADIADAREEEISRKEGINGDFFFHCSHKYSTISWQLQEMTAYKFTVCYEPLF